MPDHLSTEEVGTDGFDLQGCAACGATLLFKVGAPLDNGKRPVWLCCSGCELETRVGPLLAASSLPDVEVAPATEGPRNA